MLEGDELGNQMDGAYVKMERTSALKVTIIVSLCWPQVVPASAFKMLRRGEARVISDLMWGAKVKWGSRVTPSIRGFLSKGSCEPLRVTEG